MNSIKCKKCGLSNFPTELECRRCRQSLYEAPKKKGKKPRRFSIWSLLMLATVLGIVYYFYHGVQMSMQDIDAEEAQRLASQSKVKQARNRSEAQKQQTGAYANAVQNSSSLNAQQQHNVETQKAMQQVSNSR